MKTRLRAVVTITVNVILIILGMATLFVSVIYYKTTNSQLLQYILADCSLLVIDAIVLMFGGSFMIIQHSFQRREKELPLFCCGCGWIFSMLGLAIVVAIALALPGREFNEIRDLKVDLEAEAASNETTGLLAIAYNDGCCGVHFECPARKLSSSNNTNSTFGRGDCTKVAWMCNKPCRDAIWNNYIAPFKSLCIALGLLCCGLAPIAYATTAYAIFVEHVRDLL